MTNATHRKYLNLYTFNRYRNEIFDNWLKSHYEIIECHDPWNYGVETFVNKSNGEREFSEAKIMMLYVKGKNPYFRDITEIDEFLDSNYNDVADYFAAK